MSDPITPHSLSGEGRKFNWMPVLDGYILRSFLIPFGILLFAFTLLFIIMDMYNEIGDFLEHDAPLSVSVHFFALKIPGNIRFILPITVLLANMYALANLGRNRELTAIRASGISLVRCGMPIFAVGFCVMLVNYYFNEKLVPDTTHQAEIVSKTLDNPNYVEQTNAHLQFHSGDRLRSWYFGQFYDDGMQEKVTLKIFDQKEFVEKALPEFIRTQDYVIDTKNNNLLRHVIVAEKTFYDEKNATWMLFKPVIGVTSYSYKITKKKVEISNSKIPYAISANLFAKYYGFKTDSEFLDFPKIREDVSTRMTNQEASEWLAENHTSWPEDKKLLDDLLVRFEEAVSQDSKNAVSDELAPSGNDKPLERVFKRLAQTVSEAKKKPNIVIPAKLPDDKTRCRTILDIILKGIPNEKIDNLVSSVEYEEVLSDLRGKLDLSKDNLDILAFYDNEAKDASREMDERVYESSLFQESQVSSGRDVLAWEKDRDPVLLLVSEKVIPDKPSVIVKSVIEPEALSSYEIFRILMDNPHMSKSLKHIYETIFFNRLAFPWACFLCAFFALPLATKNERSGIFTAIATAVGIAVFYQVLNEIFMVIGKNGYLSFDLIEDFIHFPLGACLAGLAPTIIFGGYGIYLLKKVG